jgi:hypothetical protein
MINAQKLIYTTTAIVATYSLTWYFERRKRRRAALDAKLPLFDSVLLEVAVTTPKGAAPEDRELLDRARDRFKLHNRRENSAEFLMDALSVVDLQTSGDPHLRRQTLIRFSRRLLASSDPWLQAAGGKIAAATHVSGAKSQIAAILRCAKGNSDLAVRWKNVMTEAFETLGGRREWTKAIRSRSRRCRGSKRAR